MNGELIAILDGRETGRIARDDRGKLSLRYNEARRTAADSPLPSTEMPRSIPNRRVAGLSVTWT